MVKAHSSTAAQGSRQSRKQDKMKKEAANRVVAALEVDGSAAPRACGEADTSPLPTDGPKSPERWSDRRQKEWPLDSATSMSVAVPQTTGLIAPSSWTSGPSRPAITSLRSKFKWTDSPEAAVASVDSTPADADAEVRPIKLQRFKRQLLFPRVSEDLDHQVAEVREVWGWRKSYCSARGRDVRIGFYNDCNITASEICAMCVPTRFFCIEHTFNHDCVVNGATNYI